MHDVRDQLSDYWAGITADLAPPLAEHAMTERIGQGDVRPVQDRPGPESRPSARRWWQQPPMVATAAAMGAVLLVALPLVLLREGNDSPAVSTIDMTLPQVAGLAWARVPDSAGVFAGSGDLTMSSVVAGGPGLVAVGSDGANGNAAVWISADGLAWARVPDDEAVFGGPGEQWMSSVVAGGPGLVAVGVDEASEDLDAAVWTSADGLTWTRVPRDEAVFGGPGEQSMSSVVAEGPGLVAVGWDGLEGPHAAVWTSTDGLTWAQVPDDQEVFGGVDDLRMWSVAAGGPGLVAVGGDANWDGLEMEQHAVVWTSTDGLTWTRVPDDEAAFGDVDHRPMWSVVAGGPGLVAVGWDGSEEPHAVVWTSTDGLTWVRVPDNESVFGNSGMYSVAAGGPGLVAVGADPLRQHAAVWASTDGTTWARVPDSEAISGNCAMLSVVAWGSGLVAVGGELTDDRWEAAVWVSPPGGP